MGMNDDKLSGTDNGRIGGSFANALIDNHARGFRLTAAILLMTQVNVRAATGMPSCSIAQRAMNATMREAKLHKKVSMTEQAEYYPLIKILWISLNAPTVISILSNPSASFWLAVVTSTMPFLLSTAKCCPNKPQPMITSLSSSA